MGKYQIYKFTSQSGQATEGYTIRPTDYNSNGWTLTDVTTDDVLSSYYKYGTSHPGELPTLIVSKNAYYNKIDIYWDATIPVYHYTINHYLDGSSIPFEVQSGELSAGNTVSATNYSGQYDLVSGQTYFIITTNNDNNIFSVYWKSRPVLTTYTINHYLDDATTPFEVESSRGINIGSNIISSFDFSGQYDLDSITDYMNNPIDKNRYISEQTVG